MKNSSSQYTRHEVKKNNTVNICKLEKFLYGSFSFKVNLSTIKKNLWMTDINSTDYDTLNWSSSPNIDWSKINSAVPLTSLNAQTTPKSKITINTSL